MSNPIFSEYKCPKCKENPIKLKFQHIPGITCFECKYNSQRVNTTKNSYREKRKRYRLKRWKLRNGYK